MSVGCIPPAAVAVSRGGVCLTACWNTPNPLCQPGPGHPSQVWAWTPLGKHPPGPGQTPLPLDLGRHPSSSAWAGTPPPLPGPGPVNRMTDRCKNIALAILFAGSKISAPQLNLTHIWKAWFT